MASNQAAKPSTEKDAEAPADPTLVDFDGLDDLYNPQNMPLWRKWLLALLLGGIAFVVTFASTVFSTATEATAKGYGVSAEGHHAEHRPVRPRLRLRPRRLGAHERALRPQDPAAHRLRPLRRLPDPRGRRPESRDHHRLSLPGRRGRSGASVDCRRLSGRLLRPLAPRARRRHLHHLQLPGPDRGTDRRRLRHVQPASGLALEHLDHHDPGRRLWHRRSGAAARDVCAGFVTAQGAQDPLRDAELGYPRQAGRVARRLEGHCGQVSGAAVPHAGAGAHPVPDDAAHQLHLRLHLPPLRGLPGQLLQPARLQPRHERAALHRHRHRRHRRLVLHLLRDADAHEAQLRAPRQDGPRGPTAADGRRRHPAAHRLFLVRLDLVAAYHTLAADHRRRASGSGAADPPATGPGLHHRRVRDPCQLGYVGEYDCAVVFWRGLSDVYYGHYRLGVNWATSLLGFLAILFLPVPVLFYLFGARIRRKSRYSPGTA